MRRLVGLAAAATLTGMLAKPAAAQIVVQPLIGVNFAKISDVSSDGGSTSTRTGFGAGIGFQFALTPQFAIGLGGYYSQQGVKFTESGSPDVTLKLDYIQVPVTLGLGFPTGGNITPHLFAGPMIGFKMSCKLSAEGQSVNCDDPGVDAQVKSTDFGILFGGGLGFGVGTGQFVVDVYYDLGLTNIDDSSTASSSSQSPKNQVFGVAVGYAFPLGSRGM